MFSSVSEFTESDRTKVVLRRLFCMSGTCENDRALIACISVTDLTPLDAGDFFFWFLVSTESAGLKAANLQAGN